MGDFAIIYDDKQELIEFGYQIEMCTATLTSTNTYKIAYINKWNDLIVTALGHFQQLNHKNRHFWRK